MSTDVYFDFHTPEVYPFLEESWNKWYSKIVQCELSGKEVYFPERVSHLSNLVNDNNFKDWGNFREELNGQIVDRHLIAKIILAWKRLYLEAQKPDTLPECQPSDMLTAGQIKIMLNKYRGYHLVFRTD